MNACNCGMNAWDFLLLCCVVIGTGALQNDIWNVGDIAGAALLVAAAARSLWKLSRESQ